MGVLGSQERRRSDGVERAARADGVRTGSVHDSKKDFSKNRRCVLAARFRGRSFVAGPLTSLRRSAIFLVVPVSTANAYANAANGRYRRHELNCRRCRRRRRGRGRCPATGFRVFAGVAATAAAVSTEVCVRATNIKRESRMITTTTTTTTRVVCCYYVELVEYGGNLQSRRRRTRFDMKCYCYDANIDSIKGKR